MNRIKLLFLVIFISGLLPVKFVLGQTENLRGFVVSDEDNAPVVGASIAVENSNSGVTSGLNGEFSLSVKPGDVLKVSSLGFEAQEVRVSSLKDILTITLHKSNSKLNEVVITALGIKRQNRELGYSVGEIKGQELTQTDQSNFLNAMAGKIPGVRMSQMDGTMGSTVNVIIRGASSLSNDNQPLFVIDGIPVANQLNNTFNSADMGNPIADLNPDDIADVSVLKGPSASALYGSRAANGVILITTKNAGRKGLGVDFSSSAVATIMTDIYPYQTRFGSGKDGAHVFQEGENESWGSELNVGNEAVQWNSDGQKIPLVAYPDRIRDFMRTGWAFTNNASVSNTSEKTSVRLSVNDTRSTGIIPNTDLKRNTISLNGTYNLTPKLSVTGYFNWNFTRSDNRPNVDGNDRNDIIRSLYEKGAQVNIMDLKDYWMPGLEGIQQRTNASKQNNAWFLAYENTNAFKRDRLMSKVEVNWEFLPGLSLMGRFMRDGYQEEMESRKAFSTQNFPNGQYNIQTINQNETNFEGHITYSKKINHDWDLNVMAGGNRMYRYSRSLNDDASQLIIPDLYTISNGVPGTVTYNSYLYQKAIYSVFGSASVGFKDMIYLDLTARNDWSSTLPKDNRSYFYPSVSLSVILSEMVQMPDWISYVKLRGGIAEAGNDTDPYKLVQYFSTAEDWGSAKQLFMGGTLQNPTLKPEDMTSTEVGTDINFLNNRLGLSLTYYVSNDRNQILGINTPIESGASSRIINAGKVQSKGWEVGFNASAVKTNNLKVDLAFNFSRDRTRIIALTEGLSDYTYLVSQGAHFTTFVGGRIGDIWGEPKLTVTDKNSPYYGYPLLTGSGKFQKDTDPDHLVKLGNANHDFELGFQPGISYKNFSLSANIDWNQGGKFYSQTYMFLGNNGVNENTFSGTPYNKDEDIVQQIKNNPAKYFADWVGGRTGDLGGFPWPSGQGAGRLDDASFNPGVIQVVDGSGNKTYVENLGGPGTIFLSPFDANQNARRLFADKNVFSATFVKIREIALTYRLPRTFINRLHLNQASVGIIATNIYEWTKAGIHIDPERAYMISDGAWNQGFEYYNVMPWTGTIGLKLNVNF